MRALSARPKKAEERTKMFHPMDYKNTTNTGRHEELVGQVRYVFSPSFDVRKVIMWAPKSAMTLPPR
jgi:hypothetical protein